MLYGEEKVLEMTRTTLRSSARKSAREALAAIKRGHRRKLNIHLREFRGATEGEAEDEWDEGTFRPDAYPQSRNDLTNAGGWWSGIGTIASAMWERRDADHLSSFLRWAEEVTKYIDDPEERYNYVKRLVPDTVAGRHALTHAKSVLGYNENPYKLGIFFGPTYEEVLERRRQDREEERVRMEEIARVIFEYGLEREVKRLFDLHEIPRCWTQEQLADWLTGEDMYRSTRVSPYWRHGELKMIMEKRSLKGKINDLALEVKASWE